jgi:hypothetical protein
MADGSDRKLSKRERTILREAIVFGGRIEMNRLGRAWWDGDKLAPFHAIETLDRMVAKGLMEVLSETYGWSSFRATQEAHAYRCRARNCLKGSIYAEASNGFDEEIGKCVVCGGMGITEKRSNNHG